MQGAALPTSLPTHSLSSATVAAAEAATGRPREPRFFSDQRLDPSVLRFEVSSRSAPPSAVASKSQIKGVSLKFTVLHTCTRNFYVGHFRSKK